MEGKTSQMVSQGSSDSIQCTDDAFQEAVDPFLCTSASNLG
ncbi:hypothetical protein A2U01_0105381, partial [Trifolium medium]|nr:hypothetical protein [Trifolium medium]